MILLNIDTATENASVCLSKGNDIIAFEESVEQKNHASFLQPAIKKMISEAGYKLQDIDAIAVSNGPGSYTGLRVGLASAKGLCYALNKPLILLNTLEVMAVALIEEVNRQSSNINFLYAPLIDARRMEVFAAVYDKELNPFVAATPMILDEYTFIDILSNQTIVFGGSGATKFKRICNHPNAVFVQANHNAKHIVILALKAYQQNQFADIAYSEPFYLKEFYNTSKA